MSKAAELTSFNSLSSTAVNFHRLLKAPQQDEDEEGSEKYEESVNQEGALPSGKEKLILIALLAGVSALEGADSMLMPSSFLALQKDLGLNLKQLGSLSLVEALFQALSAPLWGVLADRGILQRKSILALGCLGWGVATGVLACVSSFQVALVIRACNGFCLASLRPISNGLVADVTEESRRGHVYGLIQLSLDVGMMVSSLAATPISRKVVFNVQGWRVSFVAIALVSLLMSFLVVIGMTEPPRPHSKNIEEGGTRARKRCPCRGFIAELRRVGSFFKSPTFDAIILQGIFGVVPWSALGYSTLFFQSAGVSDASASILASALLVGQAGGHYAGGLIGDRLASKFGTHGRPLTAQISVLCGIPLSWMLFRGLSPSGDNFIEYLGLVVLLGLTGTWCAAGVNWPIFSEIVPPDGRSAIIAWDTALEGASGAFFGNAAVTFLAQSIFGYSFEGQENSKGPQPENAKALGRALVWVTTVPWLVCILFYTLLHWSYPRDLARMKRLEQKQWRDDASEESETSNAEDEDEAE